MTSTLGRKPTDADYGMGEHSFDGDRLGLIDERELTERLLGTFASPSYTPPRLPAVAMELMSLSQKPGVEFKEIEALLERDAMLAGEILLMARSATFAGIRPVNSLGAALVRIGLVQLRDVVMQAAMSMRVFRSDGYATCMARLQEHSRSIANLCRILADHTPVSRDRAFLCGLLHDVGIAGILLVLGDTQAGEQLPDLLTHWPAIDRAHTQAGARMVELWKLPDEICHVVGAHHSPRNDDEILPMAAVVCQAEALAIELNLGLAPDGDEALQLGLEHHLVDRVDENTLLHAREALRLTEEKLDKVRAAAQKWLESGAG
ncbi:MAG: HDOD domain-containing protein [bacterium]|nr:HDOD domain-containing protein [bacterium]